MNISFNDNVPIYIQIINGIKKDICIGNLKGGDRLPSVRELSQELKVNQNTIQRAYQELEREGYSFTQRGIGTFIIEDDEILNNTKIDMATKEVEYFITAMLELGFNKQQIINIVSKKLEGDDILWDQI
ncbi:transcriptional regulator [Gottschalkia purinilytica]|uniref:Transcriptional regulator n=1 Tax=Gottschalkia purinilytica TaxID=1503 RepID=A0A0L0W8Y5_GOTPU|nr:GntR family transcriptional regulator [Gottschalkia purinilytica]KNF07916.1 transcriptional regulator [Gottschalkia purinilytica]